MKLTDIVTEQQLDELDVAGGIARGLGSVAKGAGTLAGVPGGMAAQYQKGKAAARAAVTGQAAPEKAAAGETDMYGNPTAFGGETPAANPKSKTALDQITQLIGDLDPADIPAVSALLQKGASKPAAASSAPAPEAPTAKPDAATVAAQTRAGKQAIAAQAAQAQMKANPAAPKAAVPQTPDQIRAAKQATAGQTARDQMAANPAAPKATAAKSAPTAPTVNTTAPDELGRIEPTMAPAGVAPATSTSNAGAAAFGNMASQLSKGNDKNYQATLDKNIAAQKAVPAAEPAGRAQGGGKVAGQLSQTPGAVKKRDARTRAADWNRLATGTESIDYSVNESRSIFTK